MIEPCEGCDELPDECTCDGTIRDYREEAAARGDYLYDQMKDDDLLQGKDD